MAQRKAADPGIVERIAGFLGNNAYTRAWAEGVDRGVITPVELHFAKQMPREEAFNAMAAELQEPAGGLTERGRRFVDAARQGHGDSPELAAALRAEIDSNAPEGRAAVSKALWEIAQDVRPDAMRGALDILAPRNGRDGYTEFGRVMRQYGLGSAASAYGVPAAGLGLAAWGIHDVMAAQQQAEKEGQLPLQGGQA